MNRHEHSNPDVVDRAAEALRQTPTPAGPPAEIVQAVLAADRSTETKPKTTTKWKRIFTMKRIAKIAACLVLAGGITTAAFLMIDRTTTVAFAEVRRIIQEAQTMTCKMTMTGIPGMGKMKMKTMVIDVAFKAPGRMRQEWKSALPDGKEVHVISITDMQQGKALTLQVNERKAILIDFGQLPEELLQKQSKNGLAELKKMVEGAEESLGEKEIDGRRAQGFSVSPFGGKMKMEIWVDPETGHPIRLEMKGGDDMPSVVMTDFAINVELDDSLFSVVPPDDYEVTPMDMPIGDVTEEDFLNGLRFMAEYNDNTFPDSPIMVSPKIMKNYAEKNKARMEKLSEEEQMAEIMKVTLTSTRTTIFMATIGRDNSHYQGKGVQLGDAEAVVGWYKPKDSETYRVIYGDLHVQDVPEEDLPEKAPVE